MARIRLAKVPAQRSWTLCFEVLFYTAVTAVLFDRRFIFSSVEYLLSRWRAEHKGQNSNLLDIL